MAVKVLKWIKDASTEIDFSGSSVSSLTIRRQRTASTGVIGPGIPGYSDGRKVRIEKCNCRINYLPNVSIQFLERCKTNFLASGQWRPDANKTPEGTTTDLNPSAPVSSADLAWMIDELGTFCFNTNVCFRNLVLEYTSDPIPLIPTEFANIFNFDATLINIKIKAGLVAISAPGIYDGVEVGEHPGTTLSELIEYNWPLNGYTAISFSKLEETTTTANDNSVLPSGVVNTSPLSIIIPLDFVFNIPISLITFLLNGQGTLRTQT